MGIEISLVQKAEQDTKWLTEHTFTQTGTLDGVPYWQAPWIQGDLYKIRGWLEGLGSSAISGWMEFVLREGLTTANGKLTIYDKRTLHNLEVLIQEMNRIAHGVAVQFPKTTFRISTKYKTKWSR